MAVTAKWYGEALLGQYSTTAARRIDWDADTIKCALVGSGDAPVQDTDNFFDDVTEITGTNYTAGGVTLTTSAPAYDTASNTLRLDATDAQWTTATFTARYAVVYKDTGVAGTSPLICYVDFGADESVSSGTFTIVWDTTDGVARIVVS